MNVLGFSLRNLKRNPRRTWIAVGSCAFTVAIMTIYGALYEGMMDSMAHNITAMELGDAQIHDSAYVEDAGFYDLVKLPADALQAIADEKMAFAPRLFAAALVASGDNSTGAQMRGIRVADETRVTEVHEHVDMGRWLQPGEAEGVVIGKTIARNLGVSIGDELIVLGQAADGSMANGLYSIVGILGSINPAIDRSGVFLAEAAFRQLYYLEEGFHEIAAKNLDETLGLSDFKVQLESRFPDYQVRTWREILPSMADMFDMSQYGMIFMILIVYVALGLLFVNSTLMSVFERTREFGLLGAIGVLPRQVVALILAESFWQNVFATLFGAALAIPISFWLERHGVDLRSISESFSVSGIAIDPVWRAKFRWDHLIQPVVFLFLIMPLSALYPAIRAARLNPIDAIYRR